MDTGFTGIERLPPKLIVFLIVVAVNMININAQNVNVAVLQNSNIHQIILFTTEALL